MSNIASVPEQDEQEAEYTYLKVPDGADSRSCLGVVLAGLAARANVGVGGLEEAVRTLEEAHARGETSYRFTLGGGRILAQVERSAGADGAEPTGSLGASPHRNGDPEWRTLVELAS